MELDMSIGEICALASGVEQHGEGVLIRWSSSRSDAIEREASLPYCQLADLLGYLGS